MSIFGKLARKISGYIESDGANIIVIVWQNHFILTVRKCFYKLLLGWDIGMIGSGTYIRGSRNIKIGKNFCCKNGLWIEAVTEFRGVPYQPKIVIGDNFSASEALHIAATNSITIGNDVLIGSKVLITDHLHGIYNSGEHSLPGTPPGLRPLTSDKSVLIEDNVFIGDNVCILPGVKIGFGSVVGANSVVTSDVPPHSIVAGSPAVVIKKFIETESKWKRV